MSAVGWEFHTPVLVKETVSLHFVDSACKLELVDNLALHQLSVIYQLLLKMLI